MPLPKPHCIYSIPCLIRILNLIIRIRVINLVMYLLQLMKLAFICSWFLKQRFKDISSKTFQYLAIVVYFVYYFCNLIRYPKSSDAVNIRITISSGVATLFPFTLTSAEIFILLFTNYKAQESFKLEANKFFFSKVKEGNKKCVLRRYVG